MRKYAIIDHNAPDRIHYLTNYVLRLTPPTVKGTADNADRYILLEVKEDENGLPASSYYWTSDSMETLREQADTYPRWHDFVNYQGRNGGEIVDISFHNVDMFPFTLSRPLLHTIENALWEHTGTIRKTAAWCEENGDLQQAEAQIKQAEELERACMEIMNQVYNHVAPEHLKRPPF